MDDTRLADLDFSPQDRAVLLCALVCFVLCGSCAGFAGSGIDVDHVPAIMGWWPWLTRVLGGRPLHVPALALSLFCSGALSALLAGWALVTKLVERIRSHRRRDSCRF